MTLWQKANSKAFWDGEEWEHPKFQIRRKWWRLHERGHSYRMISEQYGISKQTVFREVRKFQHQLQARQRYINEHHAHQPS